ncbi:MAG: response regulator [Desulfobacterales bacterium]|jgi:CheY-like chemotaxis protein
MFASCVTFWFLESPKKRINNQIKNLKILLVGDDEWIRDSLSLFFEGEGCNFLAFETAEEGMEAVKQQAYDIVISDYKLPGMDGLEFLRRVKEKRPNAFEVLITAYPNCEILKEAKAIGVKDIIPKPFTSEDVETSLARIVENSA